MMNINRSKIHIYTISVLCLTMIAILLRTLNFLFFFDTAPGYFVSSPLPVIFRALSVLTALWAFTPLITMPRKSLTEKEPPVISASATASLLCVAAFVCVGILCFFDLRTAPSLSTLLLLLVTIPLVPLYLMGEQPKSGSTMRLLSSYVTIIWCALFLVHTYLDLYTTMNSPLKLMLHLSLLLIMLHFLNRAGSIAGTSRPRLTLSVLLAAVFFTGTASFPTMIAFAAGKVTDIHYLAYSFLLAAFFVFLIARLIGYTLLLCDTPVAAEAHNAEDEENESKPQTPDEKTADENGEGGTSHVC